MKNIVISSARVVAYVVRRFGLSDDGWVADCIESIGHGLGTLNMGLAVEKTSIEREVIDFKCYPPCNAEFINGIFYGGVRLNKLAATTNIPQRTFDGVQPRYSYWFNGPYIQFTFETGCVEIHYERFACDDKGFPLIPNSDLLIEALAWNFMVEYLSAGNTHPVFDYGAAEQRWELYQARAFNDVMFPHPDDSARFHRMFTSMVPNIDMHDLSFVDYQSDVNTDNGDISQFTGVTL